MNENVDAARIVEVLNRHGVRYVVIGGYAAELHEVAGLPPTRDIDVCPDTDRENLERLSRALDELRALIRTDAVDGGLPFAHDAESLGRAEMWNLVCDAGELDSQYGLTFVSAAEAGRIVGWAKRLLGIAARAVEA